MQWSSNVCVCVCVINAIWRTCFSTHFSFIIIFLVYNFLPNIACHNWAHFNLIMETNSQHTSHTIQSLVNSNALVYCYCPHLENPLPLFRFVFPFRRGWLHCNDFRCVKLWQPNIFFLFYWTPINCYFDIYHQLLLHYYIINLTFTFRWLIHWGIEYHMKHICCCCCVLLSCNHIKR